MRNFAHGFAAAYVLAAIYAGTLFYKAGYDGTLLRSIRAAIVWPISGAGVFMIPKRPPDVTPDRSCEEGDQCVG